MRHSLIILANSRKMRNRCIAGIDSQTGEWLRPCCGTGVEGVPWNVRQVAGVEPQLLDIIEIPLAADGPHRDIQPENRQLLEGAWKKLGTATIDQVAGYCQKSGFVLHNKDRWIHDFALRDVPESKRRSLCLVRVQTAFSTEGTYRGKRVNARFTHDQVEYSMPVTDSAFERRFPAYGTADAKGLLTVSLGSPFERDGCCYKFVAGVILLTDPDKWWQTVVVSKP
jgi:hypothetical protein